VLSIDRVSKRFGRVTALASVSLDVAGGEIVALVGPNGAGKSTLLKTIIGFTKPTSGTVNVLGVSVTDDPLAARRAVGYVPQRVVFADGMRTGRVIAYYAALKGLTDDAAAEALAGVGLAYAESRPVRALSGGMMQRLALAIAMLGRPSLLVLDEPTVSLDPDGSDIVRLVLGRHRARGGAVLLATHLLADAELLADRICLLSNGCVLACDTLAALTARFAPAAPQHAPGWRPEPSALEAIYRAACCTEAA
jgi:ABC-type multidrug transport system ATPase subunit